jgi:hypothetical protein
MTTDQKLLFGGASLGELRQISHGKGAAVGAHSQQSFRNGSPRADKLQGSKIARAS